MRNLFVVFLVCFIAMIAIMAFRPGDAPQSKRFAIIENKAAKRLDVLIDGKPFTSYIYPDDIRKPALYPLLTADGSFVTRGWPLDPRPGERVDHTHHVGMWLNYGDVNGLDFWNNSTDIPAEKKDRFGTVRHRSVNKIEADNNRAVLEVTADWQKPDGSNLLLEETRFIFNGSGNMRTIERITKLTALKEDVS